MKMSRNLDYGLSRINPLPKLPYSISFIERNAIDVTNPKYLPFLTLWSELNNETVTPYKIQEQLHLSNSKIAIAFKEEVIQGYIVFSQVISPLIINSTVIEIHAVYVIVNLRLNGIGRELIDFVIEYAKSLGCKSIVVNNALEGFFNRLGFEPQSQVKNFTKKIVELQ
jgi:N-acetylglutamate synthase-like GNAT family acetyltransferase